MNTKWMLALLAALSLAVPARGEEAKAPETDTGKPKVETPPKTDEGEANRGTQKQIDKLAARYSVPPADIKALRDKGLGWGEIGHALAISERSGKPLSEVMALRDSGLGWGQIAQKYGFKLGDAAGGKEVARDRRGTERGAGRMGEGGGGKTHESRGRGAEGRGPRR